MILKNLTNSPQMVAGHRIQARGTSEPIELDPQTLKVVKASGLYAILDSAPEPTGDAYDDMTTDELKELYEVVTGEKPHHKTGRAKLLDAIRADG